MTLVTPYASAYGLAGHADLIGIAYGHVAYGTPLGLVVRQAERWRRIEDAPVPAWSAVAAVAVVVLLWHQPWSVPASVGQAESLRPQPPFADARHCFPTAGVKRVQLNGVPYSGGFVIVDASLRP